jgi:hypothetical protein
MTKKDYELIARAVYRAHTINDRQVPNADTVAIDFAYLLDALQQDNARFNRAKFTTACGMTEHAV